MRSQKRVRRIGKVRCLKNAAAGKWKTYRRRLEARKACNTLAPPPPTYRKIKEMKQRSPEELAEREQRRLEKKLAKQKASTSTLPEIRKEKKLKEASSNGSPKKASDEPKTVAKMIKTKNSMIKATAKVRCLMNGQEQRTINVTQREVAAKNVDESKVIKVPKLGNGSKPKYQYLKEERSVSTEEGKRKKPSSPIKREQKELVQSKKRTTDTDKTGKKPSEKEMSRRNR
ncbi:unnamed protein product [Cercopithifilaria johnstoni]|uniref:Uncharacterized protein n=1 Tax=Cercopithifilaria johnstoni TaxID=2874296 RepID=A0A8J2MF20_9BILA|nr:unnamed protein product [Cercopithifilaria johnstoni]